MSRPSPRAEEGRDPTMPTYEYVCGKCRRMFSIAMAITEHGRRKPACPRCGSRQARQRFAPFFAVTAKKS
jgi:putative FmdB family regulatory protein